MEMRCTLCHEFPRTGRLRRFGFQFLCHACYEENVTLCDRCGASIWLEKAYSYQERCLCSKCYEHYKEGAK